MKPYFETENGKLYHGDSLEVLRNMPDQSVNCCVTSPPYWGLRDYGKKKQLGLEETPDDYVLKMVRVLSEVKRVMKVDGTLWLNLGDTYAASRSYQVVDNMHKDVGNKIGHKIPDRLKQKDLVGISWRVAFALQADDWYLRQDIIWNKPNGMPESVKDRCTKSHEYIFLLSKSAKYFYDHNTIKEPAHYDGRKDCILKGAPKYNKPIIPGRKKQTMAANPHNRWKWKDGKAVRNKRSVWTVPTKPFKGAHFATFPEKLIEPCILAGCPTDGTVIDIFNGAGTTWKVCEKYNRKYIGIELNPEYCEITKKRIEKATAQMRLPGF